MATRTSKPRATTRSTVRRAAPAPAPAPSPAPAAASAPAPEHEGAGARWGGALRMQDVLRDAKRLAVIRAAGLAFKAKGFHNTSLDEVAAALNVTKPALYYHIRNKQDLLYQCHDHALDLGQQALDFAQDGRTGLEKLQRMLRKYMELLTDDFASYSLLSDLNDLTPAHKDAIQARRRAFDSAFRAFVREGIRDGSVRECDPMIAVAWFMGAVNAIPRWFDAKGRLSGSDLAEAYTDLITRGLQGSGRKP